VIQGACQGGIRVKQSCCANTLLGLDLGANSLGWAVLSSSNGKPDNILEAGVRIFEAGVEGTIESGKDVSKAAKRREARLRRRMLDRRRRRLKKLAGLLQAAGLLPAGNIDEGEDRHKFFLDLDRSLLSKHFPAPKANGSRELHVFPYWLRARALDEKLEPYELGRALYHLAQRRGFLSNRKAPQDDKDNKKGPVKEGIGELAKSMAESGARTLGEYFSQLDPVDPAQRRIRDRWTARQMFVDEFDKIWSVQATFYPDILTEDFGKKVHRAIFFQRPLKIKKSLIGNCELERGRKCAPMALLVFQRFRLLQKVNDLKIITPEGEERALTQNEREKLVDALDIQGDLKFKEIRKLLNCTRRYLLNLEEGGEESLIGNRTAAKLASVFGEQWKDFTPEKRKRIVEDIRSIQKTDALKNRGIKAWCLDEEAAKKFSAITFEPGHCRLSRQALKRILPLMEQGIPFATARKELYGEVPPPEPVDILPPVDSADMPELRNPAVHRALTELRRVVNAVVRKHGKPGIIRIELARDLKNPRKVREKIWKRNQQNRRAREKAADTLLKEGMKRHPTRRDIEKWLLAQECSFHCPYTNEEMNFANLFDSPQFHIEHIIPWSRCLDDSFLNKTLCYHEENQRKGGCTPREAYGRDQKTWSEILTRVRNFKGSARYAKLHRFQVKDLESIDDFAASQLNDTRHSSRMAVRYLGLLYGADARGVGIDGKRRIQAGRGQITHYLRDEWCLNEILGDGGLKNRSDYRHHAVDAVVIALTDASTVKSLSDAARRARSERRRRFGSIKQPWPGFLKAVRKAILENVIVSHCASRKINGRFHEDMFYSKIRRDENGEEYVSIRKQLGGESKHLSRPQVKDIVDPIVRSRVREKLRELHTDDPRAVFSDSKNHPYLKTRDGHTVPIHKVRIRTSNTTVPLDKGMNQRRVMTGSNHHIEILEVKDKKGQTKWESVVVSRYEAIRRLRAHEPIVQRDHGDGKKFVFSLVGGDTISLEQDGVNALYIVRTISKTKKGRVTVEYVHINDGRKKTDIKSAKAWKTGDMEPLRKMKCRKVSVTPLGEVRWAND